MSKSQTEEFLGIRPGDVVSFIGGGGKSLLMSSIAGRLAREGRKVILAATRPFHLTAVDVPYVFLSNERPFGELLPNLGEHGVVVVSPERTSDGGLAGYRPDEVDTFAGVGDYLFVEAEDSGGESLPRPGATTRWIPPLTDVLAVVAGLDALGPDLDCRAFAERLTDERGPLRDPPYDGRRVLLLNKADRHSVRLDGAKVAREMRRLLGGEGDELQVLLTSIRDFLRRL